MTERQNLVEEAFDALRDPASDPDGFGKNWCISTAKVDGRDHYVLCAVSREGGNEILLPMFFCLVPGQVLEMAGVTGVVKEMPHEG